MPINTYTPEDDARRFASAHVAIPTFRSTAPDQSTGRRHRATVLDRRETSDPALMRRAAIASHLARHPDLARATYAHCERAPLGWENRDA